MEVVFVFCSDAGVGSNGKLDIHGVFNELLAPDFPARQDRLVLAGVVEWQRDVQGRVPFKMDLIDSEGMSIFTIEGHSDVEAQSPDRAPAKTQFVLPLTNVMFPSPGHYQMRININGEDIDGPSMYLNYSPPGR